MRASELILRTARNGVIAAQVLGEFLRFVQRRAPDSFEDAMRQVTLYQSVFLTPPTTDAIVNKAFELAARIACSSGIALCALRRQQLVRGFS